MADLAKAISEFIDKAQLPPQSKVPTERELATSLGASRWQVRQALDVLAEEGKIWRHVGRGTFVGPRPPVQVDALRLLSEHSNPVELVEARQAIEPDLAAMAALRAKPAQISDLQAICRKCASARNIEVYETWDEKLHISIAIAAGNSLLLALFETVNALRKEVVWTTMRKSILKPERRAVFSSQHARIVEAIAARDPVGASDAMRIHVTTMAEVYENIVRAKSFGTGVFRT
ncbi:FadR family transcriptional regulator [Microvirga sp. BT689]|uniref:FadR/GntR family transcriptional regulator n=1 Tax=Microvirga arvi TaxID=2778731 RepID=UPI001951F770|nr:FCD domain-containing protein [Microvirga arvi]MBM6583535.1 FadR family transcriptional regulator [Microvirga arvi]